MENLHSEVWGSSLFELWVSAGHTFKYLDAKNKTPNEPKWPFELRSPRWLHRKVLIIANLLVTSGNSHFFISQIESLKKGFSLAEPPGFLRSTEDRQFTTGS